MIFVRKNKAEIKLDLVFRNFFNFLQRILWLYFSYRTNKENNSFSTISEIYMLNSMVMLLSSIRLSKSSSTLKTVQEFNFKSSSRRYWTRARLSRLTTRSWFSCSSTVSVWNWRSDKMLIPSISLNWWNRLSLTKFLVWKSTKSCKSEDVWLSWISSTVKKWHIMPC